MIKPPPPPKKSLGQHFLQDKSIIERVIAAAELRRDEPVLEVGPGTGCLTEALLRREIPVTALEVDGALVEYLRLRLADYPRLDLVHCDALRCDFPELAARCLEPGRSGWKVAANLPYYICTALLQLFVSRRRFFPLLVLMLPEDVARRVSAPPGGRTYGYISVLVQSYYEAAKVCRVPAQAFYPRPKVDSLVLKFTRRPTPLASREGDFYRRLLKAAFAQRRKTIYNSLLNNLRVDGERLSAALLGSGIDSRTRAEKLSPGDFARLAESLFSGQPQYRG